MIVCVYPSLCAASAACAADEDIRYQVARAAPWSAQPCRSGNTFGKGCCCSQLFPIIPGPAVDCCHRVSLISFCIIERLCICQQPANFGSLTNNWLLLPAAWCVRASAAYSCGHRSFSWVQAPTVQYKIRPGGDKSLPPQFPHHAAKDDIQHAVT